MWVDLSLLVGGFISVSWWIYLCKLVDLALCVGGFISVSWWIYLCKLVDLALCKNAEKSGKP